jgi:hypothetical protein
MGGAMWGRLRRLCETQTVETRLVPGHATTSDAAGSHRAHLVFVAVGAAIGTLLALLRGRILLAILVNVFFAIVVALCGLLLGYHLGLSALVGFGCIAAVQVSYLALGLDSRSIPLRQCYTPSTGRNRTTAAR